MPLFQIKNKLAQKIETEEFKDEKELQNLVEANLQEFFGLQMIASEYWTGGADGGYIDTLALDKNNSPVVIEYKWGENENVINQGLYYIDQIFEHKGDLEIQFRKKLNKEIELNWKEPRLILIAKSYNRYDQHAIKRIGGNIELVRYTQYKNGVFGLDTIYSGGIHSKKPAINAITNKSENVGDPLKERLDWIAQGNPEMLKIYTSLREQILSLDENISEKRYKNGSQYRYGNRTFSALAPWKSYVKVYLDVSKKPVDPKEIVRSNMGIGKIFKSNYDFQVKDLSELGYTMNLIKNAYKELL